MAIVKPQRQLAARARREMSGLLSSALDDAESVRVLNKGAVDGTPPAAASLVTICCWESSLPRDAADYEQYYLRLWNVFLSTGILPDWWKLPPLSPDRWREISQHIEHYDHRCRGMILGFGRTGSELSQDSQRRICTAKVKGLRRRPDHLVANRHASG